VSGSADGGGGRVILVISQTVSPKALRAIAIGIANFICRRHTYCGFQFGRPYS